MGNREIHTFCPLTPEGSSILEQAVEKMNLSARAYFRTIKLARTIADLAEEENIEPEHLSEALQYKKIDN